MSNFLQEHSATLLASSSARDGLLEGSTMAPKNGDNNIANATADVNSGSTNGEFGTMHRDRSPCPSSGSSVAEIFPTEEEENLLTNEDHSNNNKNNKKNEVAGNNMYNIMEDEEVDVFEGPEKTMEVVFLPGKGAPTGLRTLSRAQLDVLCTEAKCSILSRISNNHMDAYVLSESSLFVYKHRLIMKTCGTTTLLRCLSTLLEYADNLGMELTWVGYSRKNLLFPNAQLWPHSSFGDEIKYIDSHEKLQNRLNGSGYILGPITGDHWFVYVADHSYPSISSTPEDSPTTPVTPAADGEAEEEEEEEGGVSKSSLSPLDRAPSAITSTAAAVLSLKQHLQRQEQQQHQEERTINLMMFDLAPEVCATFYKSNCPTGKEMTAKSGIFGLCPNAVIDETAFTPCGYSMNAILHDAYTTIHVTPQPVCSYASFETNTCLRDYSAMVRNVLTVFRPKRFLLTMFGDQGAIDSISSLPTDAKTIKMPGVFPSSVSSSSLSSMQNHQQQQEKARGKRVQYVRTTVSSTKVERDLCCMMACYSEQTLSSNLRMMPPPIATATSASTSSVLSLLPSEEVRGGNDHHAAAVGVDDDERLLLLAAAVETGFGFGEKRERGYSMV